jgi:hypothetical protein
MPRAMQCLQDVLGSSGFSLAHLTLRALQASQPSGRDECLFELADGGTHSVTGAWFAKDQG